MKSILTILFILTFSVNAISGDKYPELPVINNLTKLNSILSSGISNDKKVPKPKDFSFTVNPYLWTIAAGGTIGIPTSPSGYPKSYEFNKSFSDAVKNLKMAFMIGGKFKYKKVSLYYDMAYINLQKLDITIPEGKGILSANTSSKEFITDLSLAYSFPMSNKNITLDAYAGTRIWSTENEISILINDNTQNVKSSSKSWVDPIVGINAKFLLSQNWFAYVRSDFGGFGANSEYTFMILGGFGYKFAPNWNTSLGVKDLSVDYNKDGYLFNLNQYGLILSIGYVY